MQGSQKVLTFQKKFRKPDNYLTWIQLFDDDIQVIQNILMLWYNVQFF